MRAVPFLGPDRFDLLFATKELGQDMQALSMLSMLKLRRSAWYLVGAADVSPFVACSDEAGTMLVLADADWSGNEMTCKSASAGAVQLEYHGIETWSVVQQVVSFSSDEKESNATEMSKPDRWRRWVIAGIKFAGAARILRLAPKMWLSKRSKLSKKCQIRLTATRPSVREGPSRNSFGARRALESVTSKVATARESRKRAEKAIAVTEFAFASARELPDKMSPGQDALENAKECPSDLDMRVLEREAMPRRVSKYGTVTVTSRFATSWNTRAQWSCFGFICGLARTASASDEVTRSPHSRWMLEQEEQSQERRWFGVWP